MVPYFSNTERIEIALGTANARFAHPPQKPFSDLRRGVQILDQIEDFYDFKNHIVHPELHPILDSGIERRLKPLLEDFLRMGWIRQISSGKYERQDSDAFSYIKGSWLEEYVWHVAKLAGMTEAVFNQEIVWSEPGVVDYAKNEIDLIACNGERFLLMSCKTMDPTPSGQALTGKTRDLSDNAKEVAYWIDHFFPDSGVGTLVATLDMVDEQNRVDRYPVAEVRALKQNIEILGVEDLSPKRLVEYFKDSRHWTC